MRILLIVGLTSLLIACAKDPCHGYYNCDEYANAVGHRAWLQNPDIDPDAAAIRCQQMLSISAGEKDCESLVWEAKQVTEKPMAESTTNPKLRVFAACLVITLLGFGIKKRFF